MRYAFIKTIFCLFLCSFITQFAHAQGCSDAGFCTVNSFKPQQATDSMHQQKQQFKIGVGYGKADHAIQVFSYYAEYGYRFNDTWSIDAKVTGLGQSGPDAISNAPVNVNNISDFYLTSNIRLNPHLRMTIGLKIPFNSANAKQNGVALPLDYQSSLGTLDILAGLGGSVGQFQWVAAFQQPLTQNGNTFIQGARTKPADAAFFQSTNNYKRSGDVLLRLALPLVWTKSLTVTPSLLPIYHLSNDLYTDESGVERSIASSQGLTFNFNAYFDYQIAKNKTLQLNFGFPIVARKVRPDGLTRSLALGLEYQVRF
jgi:hypothetical protein